MRRVSLCYTPFPLFLTAVNQTGPVCAAVVAYHRAGEFRAQLQRAMLRPVLVVRSVLMVAGFSLSNLALGQMSPILYGTIVKCQLGSDMLVFGCVTGLGAGSAGPSSATRRTIVVGSFFLILTGGVLSALAPTATKVDRDGNGLAYPHRTGFRPVSDQCHAGCMHNPCHSVNSLDINSWQRSESGHHYP